MRQKWNDDDPNLEPNDIVYFMMEEKVKITWKVGKVESVVKGRDHKVRKVVISYKILKDDSWAHNTVERPVKKVVKLFELQDTTFAEDMKQVQKLAKEILVKRGSLTQKPLPSVTCPDGSNVTKSYINPDAEEKDVAIDPTNSFLSTLTAKDWFLSDNSKFQGDVTTSSQFSLLDVVEEDELVLLM